MAPKEKKKKKKSTTKLDGRSTPLAPNILTELFLARALKTLLARPSKDDEGRNNDSEKTASGS